MVKALAGPMVAAGVTLMLVSLGQVMWAERSRGVPAGPPAASVQSLATLDGMVTAPDARTGDLRRLGLQLQEALESKGTDLDHRWLERFSRDHVVRDRTDRVAVQAALGSHLERLGVLGPLVSFLASAPQYFTHAGIPEGERWQVRSALCDLELLEVWAQERGLSPCWTVPIATCAGAWDRAFSPMEAAQESARSWVRWGPEARGVSPDRTVFEDRWAIRWSQSTRLGVAWYTLDDWHQGLVVDLDVNARGRRILRWDPAAPVPTVPFRAVEEWGHGYLILDGECHLLHDAAGTGRRGHVGRTIPLLWLHPGATTITATVRDLTPDIPRNPRPAVRGRVLSLF